jgi:hypothetical protein
MQLQLEALKAKCETAVNNTYIGRRFLCPCVYSTSRTCLGLAQVSLAGKHSTFYE